MLYLIPTPIGNREDITLRALRLFKELTIFFCEDTRTVKSLFAMYDIDFKDKKFYSLTSMTDEYHLDQYKKIIISQDCGLISEAGTPGLSDPGKELIKLCTTHSLKFEVLPGATALIPAVVASGFDTKHFLFFGFLPLKKGRKKILQSCMNLTYPVFFYESVHRIIKLTKELEAIQYAGLISVSREISKLHHQHWTGTLHELQSMITDKKIIIKGERVIGLDNTKLQTQDEEDLLKLHSK